jgi:hypothetical protein
MEFDNCPLTGWKLNNYFSFEEEEPNPKKVKDFLYFNVVSEIKSFSYLIKNELCNSSHPLKLNQHIFRWILTNNLFQHDVKSVDWGLLEVNPKKYGIDEGQYQIYIESYSNISPKEKLDHLLITLFEMSDNSCFIERDFEDFALSVAFRTNDELFLFLDALTQKEFISYNLEKSLIYAQLKYQGLLEVSSLKEKGQNSKRCFVAMAFDPQMNETREAIRNGIKEAGYDAVFIDEVFPKSDQTINDAIIAEIKRSKFLVADFTKQKTGVYFEAGYALGRGLKVIYCCEEKDFKKSHFDLKPFSHILYSSTEELQKRLKYKIDAWIE